jgi:hypothetical protein
MELAATVPVSGPRAISIDRIPSAELNRMRAQVGLGAAPEHCPPAYKRASIVAGVDEIVDEALGVTEIGRTAPHYRHLTAYRTVASGRAVDGSELISRMYTRVVANWPGILCRSRENWRWEKKTYISDQNESAEKRFEKRLAAESGEWYNMIPVASGVLPDVEEGGRRIDLARQCSPGWFEFVELKLGDTCNTPLHAAIEILGYGLIYVFSRIHAKQLGYDSRNLLLSARRISLKVLAPAESYSNGSLEYLEMAINQGLQDLSKRIGNELFEMDFQFEHFPAHLNSGTNPASPSDWMAARQPVYRST